MKRSLAREPSEKSWWPLALDAFSRPAEQDLPLYLALLQAADIEHVIEVGAGTGRLTSLMLSAGYSVTAIESVGCLRQALIERIAGTGKAGRCRILNDMLGFVDACMSAESRTAILMPFNVAFYLELRELRDLLSSAMAPGVNLIALDVDNTDFAHFPMPQVTSVASIGSRRFVERIEPIVGDDPRRVSVTWSPYESLEELWQFPLRIHAAMEIDFLLSQCGCQPVVHHQSGADFSILFMASMPPWPRTK